MENLWSFLYQTLTVSLTAGILLLLKRIFRDKLSPRWQYGMWSVLALRILIPADSSRSLCFPFALLLEMLKTRVERLMNSAYTVQWMPVNVRHPLPVITGIPRSITDVLFVLYAAGVMVCLLRYFTSYLRLRRILRQAVPVSAKAQEEIRQFAETDNGCSALGPLPTSHGELLPFHSNQPLVKKIN